MCLLDDDPPQPKSPKMVRNSNTDRSSRILIAGTSEHLVPSGQFAIGLYVDSTRSASATATAPSAGCAGRPGTSRGPGRDRLLVFRGALEPLRLRQIHRGLQHDAGRRPQVRVRPL